MTKEKRTRHLHITLAEKEFDTLCSDARRCGLSRSTYLRRLIMKKQIKARPTEDIRKLYAEVNRIGNNINQIARGVNAGIAKSEDIAMSAFLMKKIYELMEKVARE